MFELLTKNSKQDPRLRARDKRKQDARIRQIQSEGMDMTKPHSALSRRTVVAGGLGAGLFLTRPSLLLAATPDGAIQPQPYFANVKRALAALAA